MEASDGTRARPSGRLDQDGTQQFVKAFQATGNMSAHLHPAVQQQK